MGASHQAWPSGEGWQNLIVGRDLLVLVADQGKLNRSAYTHRRVRSFWQHAARHGGVLGA